jgi:hypothetical protein
MKSTIIALLLCSPGERGQETNHNTRRIGIRAVSVMQLTITASALH